MGNWKDSPPRLPQHLEDLDRAIMLLGALSKGDQLREQKLEELEEALGRIPRNQAQAQTWKSALKQWRREIA